MVLVVHTVLIIIIYIYCFVLVIVVCSVNIRTKEINCWTCNLATLTRKFLMNCFMNLAPSLFYHSFIFSTFLSALNSTNKRRKILYINLSKL